MSDEKYQTKGNLKVKTTISSDLPNYLKTKHVPFTE